MATASLTHEVPTEDYRGIVSSSAQPLANLPEATDTNAVTSWKGLLVGSPDTQIQSAFHLTQYVRASENLHVFLQASAVSRLHIHTKNFAWLHEQLSNANLENPSFTEQYAQLEGVLYTAISRLRDAFGDRLEYVMLVTEEPISDIQLDRLSYYGIALYLVTRDASATDDLYDSISDSVFADLDASLLRLQIHLVALPDWQHIVGELKMAKEFRERALPLLSR